MKSKQKKTPLYSRRRSALRSLAAAAAAVLVVNWLFHIGNLLPICSIRLQEELQGVSGHTQVIERMAVPQIHATHLLYLTGNDSATVLSGTYLTYLGWMDAFGIALDCTPDAPFFWGGMSMSREDHESVYVCFGRVDDPAVDRMEILVQYEVWDPQSRTARRQTAFSLTAGEAEWVEKDGRRYFLLSCAPFSWLYDSSFYAVAQALDAQGNVIAQQEIEEHSWCVFS